MEYMVKGLVNIYDNVEKKYIFKNKKNMITNVGREIIMDKFIFNTGIGVLANTGENKEYKNVSIKYCEFGNKNNMTFPDMVYNKYDYMGDYITKLSDSTTTFDIKDRKITFEFSLIGKAEAPTNITNLALIATSDSGGVEKKLLFSRLLFSQIPLGAGTSHTITYSIYF